MDSPDNSSDTTLTAVSRLLSKVLRHEPGLIGIHLNDQGWARVDELLTKLARARRSPNTPKRLRTLPEVTRELLLEVVA
jgi:putative RNA 2'-phosphotransferase